MNLSIIIPAYNEEKRIKESIRKHIAFLKKISQVDKYEIILSENGSTDNTKKMCKYLEQENAKITCLTSQEKGIGVALKNAILKAKYPYVYFNALDIPFKFQDLTKFIGKIKNYDIVFASKNHPQSTYKSKLSRIIASKIVSLFTRFLFSIHLTDTQGTFMAKRGKLLRILPDCTAKGAFFQTQIAIYAFSKNLHVSEIPIDYKAASTKSKFMLLSDGIIFLTDLFMEKIKNRSH